VVRDFFILEVIMNYLKHIFTSQDGESYSLTKLIAVATVSTMLYQFIRLGSSDFQGLGIAVTGVAVALAIKYGVEKP
jgi:hypothetical protein